MAFLEKSTRKYNNIYLKSSVIIFHYKNYLLT